MTARAHHNNTQDSHIAVLVDCERSHPYMLDLAYKVVAESGCIELRRDFGKNTTMTSKNVQDTLVRLAVMPCLQYQPITEKNWANQISLAIGLFAYPNQVTSN